MKIKQPNARKSELKLSMHLTESRAHLLASCGWRFQRVAQELACTGHIGNSVIFCNQQNQILGARFRGWEPDDVLVACQGHFHVTVDEINLHTEEKTRGTILRDFFQTRLRHAELPVV